MSTRAEILGEVMRETGTTQSGLSRISDSGNVLRRASGRRKGTEKKVGKKATHGDLGQMKHLARPGATLNPSRGRPNRRDRVHSAGETAVTRIVQVLIGDRPRRVGAATHAIDHDRLGIAFPFCGGSGHRGSTEIQSPEFATFPLLGASLRGDRRPLTRRPAVPRTSRSAG